MKIIHTSDLHLDSPLSANLDKERAAIRKRELFDTLRRISVYAESEGVSAIIIAGDLFDSARISKRRAEALLSVISEHGSISYFYLAGNHERDGLLSSGAPLPENFFVFGEDWTYFELSGTVICGRASINDGMFESLSLPREKTCIAVLHGSLTEHRSGGDTIGLDEASGKGIDYLALGHYHSYSVTKMADGGVAVYSGTPEGRGFDEATECGFVLIDTEGALRHRFVGFAKRRVMIIPTDITDAGGGGRRGLCPRRLARGNRLREHSKSRARGAQEPRADYRHRESSRALFRAVLPPRGAGRLAPEN
ncbi:MAG: DNA repair exonuclease [Clostridia bacterium]|nr:DNA repair exonuclease [Clostridia bacterium]